MLPLGPLQVLVPYVRSIATPLLHDSAHARQFWEQTLKGDVGRGEKVRCGEECSLGFRGILHTYGLSVEARLQKTERTFLRTMQEPI